MGNGMNKILPGLYVGNLRDSRDDAQLKENKITHVVSVHINAKPYRNDLIYLCISAHDNGTDNLSQHFEECNDFIHSARIYGGNVLVHCLAGMSRSVTMTAAYIMTLMNLGWSEALGIIRVNRESASPNFGFQKQLLAFQHERLPQEHNRLMKKYPRNPRMESDKAEVNRLLELHRKWIAEGDRRTRASDTYPLPHKAYQQSSGAAGTSSSTGKHLSEESTKAKEQTEDQRCSSTDENLLTEIFESSMRTNR